MPPINYYDELVSLVLQKAAEELLRINEGRFSGNELPRKKSITRPKPLSEKTIAENPGYRDNFWGKEKIYLESGEYAKARAVFDRYPERWNGDLPNAGAHLLQSYRRYEKFDTLNDYMALLHVLGRHEDAWALLNSASIGNNLPFSALIGIHMQGIDENGQMRRLSEDGYRMSHHYQWPL